MLGSSSEKSESNLDSLENSWARLENRLVKLDCTGGRLGNIAVKWGNTGEMLDCTGGRQAST